MPRYHLHLEVNADAFGDSRGEEMADDDAAMKNGALAASEVLGDELEKLGSAAKVKVTVEDDTGRPVGTITVEAGIDRAI